MPSALIVGGDGLIGAMLVRRLASRGWDVFSTSRRDAGDGSGISLDLADPNVGSADLPSVDVAVFTAAMARFVDCRAMPELARRVNVEAPIVLARRLARTGTRSILISTCAVFGGTQPRVLADAPPAPASLYGALKAEAEAGFLRLGDYGAVLRLTKVLHSKFRLFADWRTALERGESIDAFSDLHFAPISLQDVETAVLASLQGGRILQASADDDISYHDAATHLALALGRSHSLVRARSAAGAGIPEGDRPRHTSLDTRELAARACWVAPRPTVVIDSAFADSKLA